MPSGERRVEIVAQNSRVDPVDRDRLVTSDFVGNLRAYDLDTGRQVATLPGARGAVSFQQFSADGGVFVATGTDPWVNVYDTDDWTRVGTIPSEPPTDVPGGRLSPDGRALAVNVGAGVVEWSLDLDEMADAACDLAGRNLTRAEWATHLRDRPYRRTCTDFPAGA